MDDPRTPLAPPSGLRTGDPGSNQDAIAHIALLLDPDPRRRARVQRRVRRTGMEVRICEDAADLAGAAEEIRAPLIVAAAEAPGLVEAVHALRSRNHGNDALVAICATAETEAQTPPLVAAGADEIVRVDIDRRELLQRMTLLRRRLQNRHSWLAAEARIAGREQTYRYLVETSQDLIWSVDQEGHWTFLNRRPAHDIYGVEPEEMLGTLFTEAAHPEFRQRDREALERVQRGATLYRHDTLHLRRDGSPVHLRFNAIAMADADGRIYGATGTATDISSQKQLEADLIRQSLHDALTQLPNRTHLTDELARRMRLLRTDEGRRLLVLHMDIDRLKVINDSLGHGAGNQLLRQVADRLRGGRRTGDFVARVSGDEFVIVAETTGGAEDATALASWLHDRMSRPFPARDQEFVLSASAGVAVSNPEILRPGDLLRNASTAMYHAKRAGGGQHRLYDDGMRVQALQRLSTETELRGVIERGELKQFVQPIFDLQYGRLHGFEGLVRWDHPGRGILQPGEFLTVAEEIGLLRMLDAWSLRTAWQRLADWDQRSLSPPGGITLSVNLSRHQLLQPDLVERIRDMQVAHPTERSRLAIEVTEGTLLDFDDSDLMQRIHALRRLGVQLWIDDFGTGHSSLSQLHRLHVDVLKVDRSFVEQVVDNGEAREIVRTIVALADSLGQVAIAEGVETSEQRGVLLGLGCRYVQGFLYSEAVPLAAAEQMLRTEVERQARLADSFAPTEPS